jgi:hypothetical protein
MLSLRQLEGRKTALDAADEHEHDEHECARCRPRRIVNAEGTPRRKTVPPNNNVVVVVIAMFCLFSLSLSLS